MPGASALENRQTILQEADHIQCVMKNQDGDWGSICRPEAIAVTKCADER